MERVARRVAEDQGFRAKCRRGLAAAAHGGASADVLNRVRLLNDYLQNGLLILDGEDMEQRPLPWEQPPAPPAPQLQQQQQPVGSAAAHAAELPPPSPSDSDIEAEEDGATGEAAAAAAASLLLVAQQAVDRRRAAAALTIQCHFRRHRAMAMLRRLRERRAAATWLAARVLAAAAAGQRRRAAAQAVVACLRHWRRWQWRCRWRHRKQAVLAETQEHEPVQPVQAPGEAAGEAAAAVEVQQGEPELPPPQQAAAAACERPVPAAEPACPAPALQDAAGAACQVDSCCHTDAAAAAPVTLRLPTPPAAVLIAAQGPAPAGFVPGLLQARSCSGGSSSGSSSRGGSAGQAQQLQQQSSLLARGVQGGWSGGGALPSPPASRSGRRQHAPSPPQSAAAPGMGRGGAGPRELYRRSSSIQLLEAVQLGITVDGSSVASQAALGVCERMHEVQRTASFGRAQAGGGGRIGRVGSRVQRQGSTLTRGADAIAE